MVGTIWIPSDPAVLNALRHQRFGTLGSGLNAKTGSPSCAQRLTASEVWHRAIALSEWQVPKCSTPYGIRGLAPEDRDQRVIAGIPGCSTPYGIRGLARSEINTAMNNFKLRVLNALRHQRFGTRSGPNFSRLVRMCSTPYGIRGLARASALQVPMGWARVLNALRHQRFGTAKKNNRLTPNDCVLNALRHQRFGTACCFTLADSLTGAQRLTASEVWHRTFRTESTSAAASAQRLTASEVWHAGRYRAVHAGYSCSTPYGIRGLARLARRTTGTERSSCSTPYGIRGLALTADNPAFSPLTKCSTPYGIRGLALSKGALTGSHFGLCSTPYGIRGLARLAFLLSPPSYSGAQRLTASEVWHIFSARARVSLSECSTPYGIRGLAP